MEHIVQFGIGIDDECIREAIESKAEKEIMDELTDVRELRKLS